ncbi:P-loop containing nucleoside triphosphate hydrolase protein, partial [Hyaloscypha sp. PMI_1271]
DGSSNDLFIAVMGVTGSGKSTFIARCTGQAVAVGHGLKSHTSEIEVYSFQYNDKRIHLIDTPGFDDTFKPDIEVLKTAATWLSEAYQKDLLLTGIIYLHRITDTRMGGTARKDLMMFKKLCGEDSFSNVVLATTHWEKVSAEDGDRREAELRTSTEFYGTMIRRGSTMMRHMDNAISAKAVVAHLVNQHTTTVLNIQREMVADKVGLKETEAGRVLQSDIIKRTEQLNRKLKDTEERMKEAINQKNDALAKELAEQEEELKELKAAAQRGAEQLDVKMEDLFREKDEKFKKAMKELENERKEKERVIDEK